MFETVWLLRFVKCKRQTSAVSSTEPGEAESKIPSNFLPFWLTVYSFGHKLYRGDLPVELELQKSGEPLWLSG
jgi:hypothetical protein